MGAEEERTRRGARKLVLGVFQPLCTMRSSCPPALASRTDDATCTPAGGSRCGEVKEHQKSRLRSLGAIDTTDP